MALLRTLGGGGFPLASPSGAWVGGALCQQGCLRCGHFAVLRDLLSWVGRQALISSSLSILAALAAVESHAGRDGEGKPVPRLLPLEAWERVSGRECPVAPGLPYQGVVSVGQLSRGRVEREPPGRSALIQILKADGNPRLASMPTR
jgi:hypothetical protein